MGVLDIDRDDRDFNAWMRALEERHLADLTFPEVSRALRALSATYVQRRHTLHAGAALAGAGKRAAFALFYGPLHYRLIRAVVGALPHATAGAPTLIDLGCGNGAGGAAWATACLNRPRVVGIDLHAWAVGEAARTYRAFRLAARTVRADVSAAGWPPSPALIVAAFTVNELTDDARDRLLARFLGRAAAGDRIMVVEPLAGFVARWWGAWREAFAAAGGRADEWRIRADLPPIVAKLDRAAGLDHREITGRSLWLDGSA
jgi:hypothetical protein